MLSVIPNVSEAAYTLLAPRPLFLDEVWRARSARQTSSFPLGEEKRALAALRTFGMTDTSYKKRECRGCNASARAVVVEDRPCQTSYKWPAITR